MSLLNTSDQLWSIILAGGEGTRVSSLIHRWLGQPTPKQYCAFVGTRSMFQHTLDRAAKLTPPERIVTVAAHRHCREALAQLDGKGNSTILFQPANRDTAAGVFLPLTYIRARAPKATVVLYPSDHFVYPEARFLDTVRHAVRIAESQPDRLVMLGVAPDRLELDYGWILPGPSLAGAPDDPAHTVRWFMEKPGAAQADAAMLRRLPKRQGGTWLSCVPWSSCWATSSIPMRRRSTVSTQLWMPCGWPRCPTSRPMYGRASRAP